MTPSKQKLSFQGILSNKILSNRINFLVRKHKKTNREVAQSCNQVKNLMGKIQQTKRQKTTEKQNFDNSIIIKNSLLDKQQSKILNSNLRPYMLKSNSTDRLILSQLSNRIYTRSTKAQIQQQPKINRKNKLLQEKKENYKQMKLKFQENQKYIQDFKHNQIRKKKIQKMECIQQIKLQVQDLNNNKQDQYNNFVQFQQQRRFLNLQETLRMIQLKKKLVTQQEKQLIQYENSLVIKQNMLKAFHTKGLNKINLNKIKKNKNHFLSEKTRTQNQSSQRTFKQHFPEVKFRK